MRAAVTGIQLQRALVRRPRRRRIGLLQIAAALVRSVRVEGRGRLARQRSDAAGDLRGAEVEEDLPILGAPLARAVADHDAVSLGADVHVAQRPSLGQLRAQLAQRGADAAESDVRAHQALRRAEQHQVLEVESQLAARPARGLEESGAHVRSKLAHR